MRTLPMATVLFIPKHTLVQQHDILSTFLIRIQFLIMFFTKVRQITNQCTVHQAHAASHTSQACRRCQPDGIVPAPAAFKLYQQYQNNTYFEDFFFEIHVILNSKHRQNHKTHNSHTKQRDMHLLPIFSRRPTRTRPLGSAAINKNLT